MSSELIHTFGERVIKSSRVVSEEERPFLLRLERRAREESLEERAEREERLREVDSQAKELIQRAQAEREKVLSQGEHKLQEIVDQGKKEAEKILAEAKTQKEAFEREARKAGFEAGHQEGYAEGLKKGQELFERLNTLYEQAILERRQILDEANEALVDVVIDVTKKLIKSEIQTDPTLVMANVKEALSHVKGKEEVIVRVNPRDLEVVEEHREEFGKWVKGLSSVEIKMDSSLAQGGCVVETNFGKVDARIESQLEEVEKALRSTAHEGEADSLFSETGGDPVEQPDRDFSETAESEKSSNEEGEGAGGAEE